MATKSANSRINNYTTKLIPARVAEDFTAKMPTMVSAETTQINQMTDIEDRVRGILATEAVISMAYPKYYAFSKEVYGLQRHLEGGNALITEVALCEAKWTARGCTSAVLDTIRTSVFAIPAPLPPSGS
jgi:hypothetical protein